MSRRNRLRLIDASILALILLLVALLAGCSATGGAFTVNVPVPIPCQEKEPEQPFMSTDALALGANTEQWVRAARAELLVREGYEDRLRTALRACIAPVTP